MPKLDTRRPAGPGGDADLASAAAMIAEPARARILLALTDGRALPASVLAGEAGLSGPATTNHLNRLLDGGLVTVEASGRHRYYRLAGPHVAVVLEPSPPLRPPIPSVPSARTPRRPGCARRAVATTISPGGSASP